MAGFIPVTINLTDARELLDFLLRRAEEDELGKSVAISIVDVTCKQICAAAMDGVKAPSVTNALNKAVTAVLFQRDTVVFENVQYGDTWAEPVTTNPGEPTVDDRWSASDLANAGRANPNFCSWAGGALITSERDGSIKGAVGVSGRSPIEDHDLAALRPSDWPQEFV